MSTGPFLVTSEQTSPITDFYRGRSLFITGGSGFVGKVLVEKFLRSCPDIETIFILIRHKKGNNPAQRLEAILNSKLFESVHETSPELLRKIVAIDGDMTLPGLGVSPSDLDTLKEKVSVVFHCAAAVRFQEPLKISVDMNVLGTKKVIELCKKMPHLKALVHVSTAYCNCNREVIEEKIYPSPLEVQKLVNITSFLEEFKLLEKLTPRLLNGWPNTYTFTKAAAENLFQEESVDFPVAIVRPSIVIATWKETLPGWTETFNGPNGLNAAAATGLLQTMLCDSTKIADLIPVDVVVNLMIAVGWRTATHRTSTIKVYHCTSGQDKKLTWGQLITLMFPYALVYPTSHVIRHPQLKFTTNRLWNAICKLYQHYIPAYLYDLFLRLQGEKPKLVGLYTRLHRAINTLEFFSLREWTFLNENTKRLSLELSGRDIETFSFDISDLEWSTYFENYAKGVRTFLFKEDWSTLPAAKVRLRRSLRSTRKTNLWSRMSEQNTS
ncbi:putative fatty acyl-CoA reductase CG5065 isoform X2 [Limulus polyphemus]|uniref:Fatty acyl-CoA reductase n=1 Tax=Limulus polyphemus TaxID=6850 RepID=A0ABM1TB83_LIMPO|nr:putative fatty acyl-CoA reductase CG5065 isoform X2 [Limulus polyphemus]